MSRTDKQIVVPQEVLSFQDERVADLRRNASSMVNARPIAAGKLATMIAAHSAHPLALSTTEICRDCSSAVGLPQ